MLRPAWFLVAVVASGCGLARTAPFDFAAACDMAKAPTTTAADLQRLSDNINAASDGDYQPKGRRDVERWRSAVLLAEAARKAAAPYALPSEFRGNLPARPDSTEVRALQRRLATACRD